MQLPVSTRKRKADASAPGTELVTLRNIIKRLYNTARTNLFTAIIKTFRHEAGAQTSVHLHGTMASHFTVYASYEARHPL